MKMWWSESSIYIGFGWCEGWYGRAPSPSQHIQYRGVYMLGLVFSILWGVLYELVCVMWAQTGVGKIIADRDWCLIDFASSYFYYLTHFPLQSLHKNQTQYLYIRFHSAKKYYGQPSPSSSFWYVVKFQSTASNLPSHPIHSTGCVSY